MQTGPRKRLRIDLALLHLGIDSAPPAAAIPQFGALGRHLLEEQLLLALAQLLGRRRTVTADEASGDCGDNREEQKRDTRHAHAHH